MKDALIRRLMILRGDCDTTGLLSPGAIDLHRGGTAAAETAVVLEAFTGLQVLYIGDGGDLECVQA